MITEVVYTETYKITLIALIDGVEKSYGAITARKLLNRLDGIVKKIIKNPYLYQAKLIDSRY